MHSDAGAVRLTVMLKQQSLRGIAASPSIRFISSLALWVVTLFRRFH